MADTGSVYCGLSVSCSYVFIMAPGEDGAEHWSLKLCGPVPQLESCLSRLRFLCVPGLLFLALSSLLGSLPLEPAVPSGMLKSLSCNTTLSFTKFTLRMGQLS